MNRFKIHDSFAIEPDLFVFANVSMDTLDYTGPTVNEGSKGVWLGLGDPVRTLPEGFQAAELPAGVSDVFVFCPGCVVAGGPRYADEPGAAARVARHPAFRDWPLVVLTDEPRRAAASAMNFLWTTFMRFEPAADIHAATSRVVRNHIAFTPPIVIDARVKPWYPAEVSCDPAVASRVSQRWREYFPAGVEMGDSESGHLDPPRS
jgi:3-polyprenyl-4-hydroxybenzoate decarboxylase